MSVMPADEQQRRQQSFARQGRQATGQMVKSDRLDIEIDDPLYSDQRFHFQHLCSYA
jgi:hypothetical protein